MTLKCESLLLLFLRDVDLWVTDQSLSMHQGRAGNITIRHNSPIYGILSSLWLLSLINARRSLKITTIFARKLRITLKVIEGYGDLGTRLNFDTSREEQLGRNVTLTKAPAHIGENPGKKTDL